MPNATTPSATRASLSASEQRTSAFAERTPTRRSGSPISNDNSRFGNRIRPRPRNHRRPMDSPDDSACAAGGSKSRRKPGGQPGHPGHSRPLVPDRARERDHRSGARRCRHCQRALHARDEVGDPRRHQVTELPPIEAHITEYRCHRDGVPTVERLTQAPLPDEVVGQFGPQLTALIAYLTVVCRMPRLVVQRFLEGALQIPISLGSTQNGVGRSECGGRDAVRRTRSGLAARSGAQRRRDGAPDQRRQTLALDASSPARSWSIALPPPAGPTCCRPSWARRSPAFSAATACPPI